MAGGRAYYGGNYSPNDNYYLYNGKYFWTLSSAHFSNSYSYASVWRVLPSGSLYPWNDVSYPIGVRPVINLKTDIQITKGDGTAINPFVIKW